MRTCLTGFPATDVSAIACISREGDGSMLKSSEREAMEGCQSQMNTTVRGYIIIDLKQILTYAGSTADMEVRQQRLNWTLGGSCRVFWSQPRNSSQTLHSSGWNFAVNIREIIADVAVKIRKNYMLVHELNTA